ncbi:MAG: hypothetical protein P8Z30_11970, partial [Acidobacteriota bacterium]
RDSKLLYGLILLNNFIWLYKFCIESEKSVASMPLPKMYQLFQDALELPLFLGFMEDRMDGQLSVLGDFKLLLSGFLRH